LGAAAAFVSFLAETTATFLAGVSLAAGAVALRLVAVGLGAGAAALTAVFVAGAVEAISKAIASQRTLVQCSNT
jgi:hypothetical protein